VTTTSSVWIRRASGLAEPFDVPELAIGPSIDRTWIRGGGRLLEPAEPARPFLTTTPGTQVEAWPDPDSGGWLVQFAEFAEPLTEPPAPWQCHVCGHAGDGAEFLMIRPADQPGGLLAQCAEAFLCVTRQYEGDVDAARAFLESTTEL
jgi:hypothetical protein